MLGTRLCRLVLITFAWSRPSSSRGGGFELRLRVDGVGGGDSLHLIFDGKLSELRLQVHSAARSARQLWPPRSPCGGTEEFLRRANERALWVTELQGEQKEARMLRNKYTKLLGDLPECCALKFGEDTLGSERGRAQLVLGLVKKRTGELVELDRMLSGWQLRAVAPGSASVALLSGTVTQWLCREGGEPAGRIDFQFGYPGSLKEVRRSIRFQVMDMVERHGVHAVDLAPDWRLQIFRVRAPCRWTDEFEWHRTGLVVRVGGHCGFEAAEELQVARLCERSPVSDSERSGDEEDFAARAAFRTAYAWPRWECHRS